MRMSQPGPSGQANARPGWRWLLALGAFGFLAVLALPRGATPGIALTYTRFVADIEAGAVRAVTIDPAGQVTGRLANGQPFTSTIPVALGDRGLAGDLAAHHVQVTATAADQETVTGDQVRALVQAASRASVPARDIRSLPAAPPASLPAAPVPAATPAT